MPQHENYAEIFGGSGAVLLRKPASKIEIFNDINEGITNFFTVIRDEKKLKELQRKLSLTMYNETDYHNFATHWKSQPSDVEKAFQWYYVAQLSFSGVWGKGPRFALNAPAQLAPTVQSYLYSIENLDLLYSRLRNVQILNRNWQKCFKMCDSKDFLIYLDPPYVPETRIDGNYPDEMTSFEHEELVERIVDSKAMILLSGYANNIYSKLLKNKWTKLSQEVKVTCSHQVGAKNFQKTNRTECLYFNRAAQKLTQTI